MQVHTVATASNYVSVVLEWDEWDGAPNQDYLCTVALGAAMAHLPSHPLSAATVHRYLYGGRFLSPTEDTSIADGVEVWVAL